MTSNLIQHRITKRTANNIESAIKELELVLGVILSAPNPISFTQPMILKQQC